MVSTSSLPFHPATARWFTETLGEPTAAQRRGWASIRQGRHTLIAAPTGSGKTLAAFLTTLDDLLQEGLCGPMADAVRVVYVSPLKALSADIHKNLSAPRRGIRRLAAEMGLESPRITAAVRTGDTSQAERAAMLRTPPHILVTTPESLYLLLTAERSREMLRTVRTVIVDEIHAVIGTRRGAHLALSLERLAQVAEAPLVRIGLSATQNPVEEVARFLVGTAAAGGAGSGAREHHSGQACTIVDEGHRRDMDLGLELPRSPLEAVMSSEVWQEYYDRLAELIEQHRTTLVFVNTRRMAERMARHLSDRLGHAAITAHHGSLSKEKRLDAETRLKGGQLRALVATASLELGIDIGHVDLACQIGSPHRIATLIQRIGRSGHTVSGVPKGRIFPTSRDDLIESAALLRAIRRGVLDRIVTHDSPLDVLTQQVVAETACRDYADDELFELVRRAWPFRDLDRAAFDAVVQMAAEGFATRRGRRGALIHRDEIHRRLRGRRGARLLALTSGGAIPEVADYRVVLEPDELFIGTLNEDFAIESMTGDVFQLGNASWRVLQVASGTVRVADAKGAPPNIPFWFGEAPARSDELSRAVSDLRADIEARLLEVRLEQDTTDEDVRSGEVRLKPDTTDGIEADVTDTDVVSALRPTLTWLQSETGLSAAAAEQAVAYLADARRTLGVLPTQATLVLERFFDESGGMQLVLHAPFGSRINKAWGLALRKRFCRQFNFELQAAATEDALLLSLGPQHSFPLADVFRYLHPATARDVLVQAFLDAPVFQTRWRWNTTISLAIPRNRSGRKVPPQLQRSMAEDLLAAVFPDAAACLENIPGDRQIPDHPLVGQTVRDCLQEAMDFAGLAAVLARIHGGELRLVARDTPEPSSLAHEILNARPYAFLDDAPLEERRAHAVYTRRAGEPPSADGLGALDSHAIQRVRDEVRPDPRDADELHDALLTTGFFTAEDAAADQGGWLDHLMATRRVARITLPDTRGAAHAGSAGRAGSEELAGGAGLEPCATEILIWAAAERLPEIVAVHPDATIGGRATPPASRAARQWTRAEAIVELLRGRLTIVGPTTAGAVSSSLSIDREDATAALIALESEGAVLRGSFTAGAQEVEWCDRRLVARIHRYTLNRLRAEIDPVSAADFMRFLLAWQHTAPSSRLAGVDGLRAAIAALDGFELAASAWERAVLPLRVDGYEPSMLDMLCLAGDVGWARLSAPVPTEAPAVVRLGGTTPIALFLREHTGVWQSLRHGGDGREHATVVDPRGQDPRHQEKDPDPFFGAAAGKVLAALRARGASFLRELAAASALDEANTAAALGDLVAAGLVTSDGFAGLRAILRASAGRSPARDGRANSVGRWSLLRSEDSGTPRERAVEAQAWVLLRRYGVVFRRLLAREANAAPWRELARVYRRLEARGEIRGGRFVSGMSGEQFALPDAVDVLRETRRTPPDGRLITISAADPLNLTGIITPGERVRAIETSRIVYRDGIPLAALQGDYVRPLSPIADAIAGEVASALTGRRVPAIASGFVGA